MCICCGKLSRQDLFRTGGTTGHRRYNRVKFTLGPFFFLPLIFSIIGMQHYVSVQRNDVTYIHHEMIYHSKFSEHQSSHVDTKLKK